MTADRQRPDRRPPTGAPRWVKAVGIIAVILLILFVILHLTGNGMGGHAGPMGDAILAVWDPSR